jgi:hypothetical protein
MSVRKFKLFFLASKFKYIVYLCFLLGVVFVVHSLLNIPVIEEQEMETNPRFDHIAIALKTGKDIALQRAPIQLVTFLREVKNKIIIGDETMTIGKYTMLNVISSQTNSTLNKRDQKEVTPDEQSIGWKNDARKNIQGFSALYDHFPFADWFVMIDDDTFILKENLRWFLKRYNPHTPFYFGTATRFRGCDGITEMGKGPFFAHGGSGIVLSRGALLKMLEIKTECLVKYDDCWAGDIRVALCLRDAGISLLHSPRFHGTPPNDHADLQHPCSRPISFHHLFPSQIQKLYDLEVNLKKRLSDIVVKFLDHSIMTGHARPEHTYKTVKVEHAEECKSRCRLQTKCLSYSFKNGNCELKDAIVAAQYDPGSATGVMLEHYECFSWQQIQHS